MELTLDAYLPPGYVMDEIERVDLYRRASGLGSLAEVEDLAEELVDRFGELPEPAQEPARPLAGQAPRAGGGRELRHLPLGNLTVTGATAGSARPRPHKKGDRRHRHDEDGQDIRPRPRTDPLTLAEETLRALVRSARALARVHPAARLSVSMQQTS